MKIREIESNDYTQLLDIWLLSVRATHTFLTEDDIQSLLPLVRDEALPQLELWVLCSDTDIPIGFMGLAGTKVEALFIAPEWCRQGGGRLLLEQARRLKGKLTVDVNEQNPEALHFYLANGFTVVGRSEVDDSGRAFPLLRLAEAGYLP